MLKGAKLYIVRSKIYTAGALLSAIGGLQYKDKGFGNNSALVLSS
jgi:hypothetical protein